MKIYLYQHSSDIRGENFLIFEDYIKDCAGFENVPENNRDKVWQMALDKGKSGGYSEVYNYLLDLVELFK